MTEQATSDRAATFVERQGCWGRWGSMLLTSPADIDLDILFNKRFRKNTPNAPGEVRGTRKITLDRQHIGVTPVLFDKERKSFGTNRRLLERSGRAIQEYLLSVTIETAAHWLAHKRNQEYFNRATESDRPNCIILNSEIFAADVCKSGLPTFLQIRGCK
jgi:hypothetical protein